jgi:large subunit ribosomal protein L24
MNKIKVGDTVKVISGKDKGREGKVEKILPKKKSAVVVGVNMYKRHLKGFQGQKGGIHDIARPILISKVILICPNCKKATRVGVKIEKEEKLRICKKCNKKI